MKWMIAMLAVVVLTVLPLRAQERASTTAPAHEAMHADSQPHPAISEDSSWAGAMIIIVLGLFLAAAVIGPVVRANMPPEPPPDHGHDDEHGSADHHDAGHGHGGGHGHGH